MDALVVNKVYLLLILLMTKIVKFYQSYGWEKEKLPGLTPGLSVSFRRGGG